MVLVSDVLEHIGRIYSPLNLANIKFQKLKCVSFFHSHRHFTVVLLQRVAVKHPQYHHMKRVFNSLCNPEVAHILVFI